MLSRFAALTISALVASVSMTSAAEIYKYNAKDIDNSKRTASYIAIKGDIVKGDEEKVLNLFRKFPQIKGVYLKSYGGDALTSIEIAEIVLHRKVATFVGNGDHCESGCGLIYLMGARRYMVGEAIVSLHTVHGRVTNPDGSFKTDSDGRWIPTPLDADDQLMNSMVAYLMGKRGLAFDAVAAWVRTPGNEKYIITPKDNDEWQLNIEYVDVVD